MMVSVLRTTNFIAWVPFSHSERNRFGSLRVELRLEALAGMLARDAASWKKEKTGAGSRDGNSWRHRRECQRLDCRRTSMSRYFVLLVGLPLRRDNVLRLVARCLAGVVAKSWTKRVP